MNDVEKATRHAYLISIENTFGYDFARLVAKHLDEPEKERNDMITCKTVKSLYAVFVVDVEAGKVEEPKYEIATSPENARYKTLYKLGIDDPDSVNAFVQFIGQLKDADK